MENKKHNISIGERLYKDIKDYCEFNSLKLNEFVEDLLKKSFAVEKFGAAPFEFQSVKREAEVLEEPKKSDEKIDYEPLKKDFFSNITFVDPPIATYPEEDGIVSEIEKVNETLPNSEEVKTEELKVEPKPKRKVTRLK